jgi:hypothetical protein
VPFGYFGAYMVPNGGFRSQSPVLDRPLVANVAGLAEDVGSRRFVVSSHK